MKTFKEPLTNNKFYIIADTLENIKEQLLNKFGIIYKAEKVYGEFIDIDIDGKIKLIFIFNTEKGEQELTIAHETLHATIYILKFMTPEIILDNEVCEEAMCYMQGWFIKKLNKLIKSSYK